MSRTGEGNLIRLWGASFVLFILATSCSAQQRDITLGDALLALAKDIRENTAKLERHEMRERHLGEHLKKAIVAVEKRVKADTEIDRLHTAMNKLQGIIQQRDEREHLQLQRILDAIDTMQRSGGGGGGGGGSGAVEAELRAVREQLGQLTLQLAGGASSLPGGTEDLLLASEKLREAAASLVQAESLWRLNSQQSETLMEDLKTVVKSFQQKEGGDDEEATNLGSILDSLESIQKIFTDTSSVLERLDRNLRNGVFAPQAGQGGDNSTLEAIAELREELLSNQKNSAQQVLKDISEARQENSLGQADMNVALAEIRRDGVHNMESIKNVEKVIVQTADSVLDTKRRVEFGVQQVVFKSGEAVKEEAKELHEYMTTRFDHLTSTILLNQTNSLKNLSSKIEAEISQVWRQIGIMYRQLSQSAGTLDRLQSQTESYVNGSLTTMDDMSGKVGMLSSRMGEVDDNLSYLLGRLSLVTDEFNHIKRGLGEALEQARNDFLKLKGEFSEFSDNSDPGEAVKRPINEPLDDNQVDRVK